MTTSVSTSSAISPQQQAFIDALKNQVNQQFGAQLDGSFVPMSMPSGFYYGIQVGPNNAYNQNFLSQIDLQAVVGSNGLFQPTGNQFSGVYRELIDAIVFAFSSADRKALDQDLADNQAQVSTLITAWETDSGASITAAQQQASMPATKLGYIQAQVDTRWQGDVDSIPSSMQAFKNAYSSFQTSAQVANRLTLQSAGGMTTLKAIRANLKATADNGGLQTLDNHYALPYGPFPTQNALNNSLQSTNRTVSVSFKIDNFSSDSCHLSVEGQTAIEIPIADVVGITIGGGASYTLDRYASAGASISVSMQYQGVTTLSTPLTSAGLSQDQKTGWYDNDVLSQAVANPGGNNNSPKTGYSIDTEQFPISSTFGEGGSFSRFKTWVISQPPTIDIEITGGETSSVASDFKQNASVKVDLLGLFNIGSATESYEVASASSQTADGSASIKLAAPDFNSGTTNLQDARAYLIGGVPSYPPNEI